MRNSDWSSDVCSSDLKVGIKLEGAPVSVDQEVGNARRRRQVKLSCQRRPPQIEVDQDHPLAGGLRRADGKGTRERRLALFRQGGSDQDHARARAPGGDLDGECAERLRVGGRGRSEEHTSELQSLMRISYAVFCLK